MTTLVQRTLLTLSVGLVCILSINTPINKGSKLNLKQYNLNKLFEYEIQKDKSYDFKSLLKYSADTEPKSFDLNQLVKPY